MKTWNIPRVEMERFSANEYVAACKQDQKPLFGNDYAVDFFNDYSLDYDGPADGTYNGSQYENVYGGSLPSAFTNYSINPSGHWFTSKPVYKMKSHPNGSASYSNKTYFEYIGEYDIYVSKKGVTFWAYIPGSHGDIDPDEKPYS